MNSECTPSHEKQSTSIFFIPPSFLTPQHQQKNKLTIPEKPSEYFFRKKSQIT